MAERKIDVLFLGGGTGGYEAAIRAAQQGLRVTVVERGKLGGVCLHQGCIPSKALLRTAEVMATVREAAQFGVVASAPALDWAGAQARKERIVEQLHRGVEGLVQRAGVEVMHGVGTLMPPSIFAPSGSVSVDLPDGGRELLTPDAIVIATGSSPRALPGMPFDGKKIISSDDALLLASVPASVLIVGAGAIGCEWASLFNDLGSRVELVEALDRLLPLEDAEVSQALLRSFERRGIACHVGHSVDAATLGDGPDGVAVEIEGKGGRRRLSAAVILVAIGRRPNSEGIGLQNFEKVEVERGYIRVDPQMRTGDPHIYAIGDVVGGLQLAHVAVHEGLTAVEAILGHNPPGVDHTAMPRCTYTRPEVASVGLTEAEARSQGREVKTGRYFFRANGKALILGESEGFAKIVADAATGDLLGVHLCGPHVTDLIAEGTLALQFDGTLYDLQEVVHAHPTLYEVLNDAALAADGRTA